MGPVLICICHVEVAQIFNMPHRRFIICRALERSQAVAQVVALQTASLRYGRLKICATGFI